MKIILQTLTIIFLWTGTLFAAGTQPPGSGTVGTPYYVSSLDHLLWISTNSSSWGSYFEQIANIDASATSGWNGGTGFSPIGFDTSDFTGNYNGLGHTIDGLYINRTAAGSGLFGRIAGGTVTNLGLTNVYINSGGASTSGGLAAVMTASSTVSNCYSTGSVSGTSWLGGLVGTLQESTTMNNCYSTASVTGTSSEIGGLVGFTYTSTVNNSYSTGNVSGAYNVGGLMGINSNGSTITSSYSTGNVTGTNDYVGGLVGANDETSLIRDSYSQGNVTRASGTGTYYGAFSGYNKKTIEYCYATGSVTYVGEANPNDKGFSGGELGATVYVSNFFDSQTSYQTSGIGAAAKTTIEMKSRPTFTDAGWDFMDETTNGSDDFWGLNSNENGGYPFLEWQGFSNIIPPEINIKQAATNIADGGSYDYGSKVSGSDTDIIFTIENTGGSNLTVLTSLSITGTNADQFSIQSQPDSPVPASGSTTFTVRFSPTSAGAKTATISITNNDSDENPYNLNLKGTGTVPEMDLKQSITAIPDGGSFNWGNWTTGSYAEIVFRIENNGTGSLGLTTPLSITGTNADQFSIESQPASPVSASGSTTFTVRFSPTSTGAKTATISIANTDSDENPYDLTINGTGTTPEINLKQSTTDIFDGGSHDYGSKASGTNTDVIFTIENTGTANLTLTTPLSITGTNADQFSIESQPASPVSASGTTTFTVRFSPTSAGAKTAAISIANNDSDENPYDLTLNGTGTAPEINLKQATTDISDGGSHDYGNKAPGTNTDVVFTIENTGTANLTLTTPLSITGTNADQFSIESHPASPIPASGTTTFTVRFSPTSAGAKTAAISIANNDSDENPYDLTLNGTGTVPEINLKQSTTAIPDGGSFNYGSKAPGTDTDTVFTIENTGTAELTLTTPLSITGTNADQFSVESQPTSPVSAPGITTFTVRFSPTSAGAQIATLSIANNDSDENPYDLTLNGSGIAGTPPPGLGTSSAPYQISILDHLLWISTNPASWDKHFVQTAAIGASTTSAWNPDGSGGYYGFSPIGSNTAPFTGSYDGQNYTISNLYINRASTPYNGFFGVTSGATVKNVGLSSVNIYGYFITGALVGDNRASSIVSNCYSTGTVSANNVATGGLVGKNQAEVNNCYSTCSVSSSGGGVVENYTHVGGLVGWNVNSAMIVDSYSTGPVTGSMYIGGLVGFNELSSIITNCYSTGAVSSSSSAAGGFVGLNRATVSNCYSSGDVTRSSGSSSTFGAFCGTLWDGSIEDSYSIGSVIFTGATDPTDKGFIGSLSGAPTYGNNFWDSEVSNQTSATGATSKTTAEMKTLATFTDLTTAGLDKPWDFNNNPNDDVANNDYWDMDPSGTNNAGYPYLLWQYPTEPEINVKQATVDIADGGSYNYGSTAIDTNTDIIFTIENSGTADLTLTTPLAITGADADQFSVLTEPTSPVSAGGSTTFTVRFSPTGPGTKTAAIGITNNDSNENPYDLTLNGTGIIVPEMDLKQGTTPIADGGSYNYGSTAIGTNTVIIFTIENSGTADLTLTTPLTLTGADADQFSVLAEPTSLVSAGGSTTFTVRFSPTGPGTKTAAIAIANNDSNENPYNLTLNGTGTTPEMDLKQGTTPVADGGSYNYGSKTIGTDTDIIFTIENSGTANLTLTTPLTLTGADADQFSILAEPTSLVSAGGSTTFTVRFSPTGLGAKTAAIAIANNDSNENPYNLTLNGTGTAPEMDLKQGTTPVADGGSYNYGSTAIGTNTDIIFTIENSGTANLTLTTPLAITGTDADQFSILAEPTSPASAGGSTTFTIRFSPTGPGAKTAAIAIANNDSNENPYNLTLNGTGTAPEMDLKQGTTPVADGGSYNYGSKTIGTNTDIIFTIENSGTANLTLTTPLTLTGTDADQFSVLTEPTSPVSAGGNTTFTIRFTPTSEGDKTASIAIANNDSDENPYDLILNGYGTVPEIHLMQATTDIDDGGSHDFGDKDSGSNADVIFTIHNFGTGDLTLITPLAITGANADQFSIQAQPTSPVPSSGTTTFTIRFSPTSEGDKTASIAIANNDSDENPYDLILYGYGTGIDAVPEIHLMQAATDIDDGGSHDFGDKDSGSNADVIFTIENFGTGSLTLTTPLTLTGANADQFSILAQPTSPVSADGNTAFTIRFSPTSLGDKTASIAIANNDSDENPYDLILYGYGTGVVVVPEIHLKQATTDINDGGSHDFGNIDPGNNTDVIFTIENFGTGNLTLTTPLTVTGANADQFSVQAQPTSPVAGGGSTTFTVRFSPTGPGAKTAAIAIANNDSNENPYNLTLNGAGTTPEMDLKQGATPIADGGSYNYGSKTIGTNTDIIFTIENSGTADLTLTTPLAITGTYADQFSVLTEPTSPASAGGSTTFTIRFSPTGPGAKTAAIAIANNDSNENPYNLTLNGTGTAPEMDLKQGATPIADGGSYNYGSKTIGTDTDIIFTIENSGTANLTLTTPLAITGTYADQFSVLAEPTSPVSADGNTTFTIRFTPTSEGDKTASIAIANNDSDENPYDLILNGYGTGVVVPEIHLKQAATDINDGGSHDFGNIDPGSNTDIIFTIENFGAGSLTLTTPLTIIGVNADQFSIQSQPTSPVVGGGNTTFTIRFSPTSEGDKTASIAIGNNDSDENPYDLVLHGYGTGNYPTHTVSTSAPAGEGSFSPTSRLVDYGNTTTFDVIAESGYAIDNVTGCDGTWTGSNPYTTGTINADCTVTATFIKFSFPWTMFLPAIINSAQP